MIEAEEMAAKLGDSWNAASYAKMSAHSLRRYVGFEEALEAMERAILYRPDDATFYEAAGHMCFPDRIEQAVGYYRRGAALGCATCKLLSEGLSRVQ